VPRPKTWKLRTVDRYGRSRVKTVNIRLDISDFTDCAVFAYLLMAANPQLSTREISDILDTFDWQCRSQSWVSKRLWMTEPPKLLEPSADGLDEQAAAIMRNNPRLSSRKLSALLRSQGVQRTPQWVYRSRMC
jgi:hypothetical protein